MNKSLRCSKRYTVGTKSVRYDKIKTSKMVGKKAFEKTLDGKRMRGIRDGTKTWLSIMDVMMYMTGQNNNHAGETIRKMKKTVGETKQPNPFFVGLPEYTFTGNGQISQTVIDGEQCFKMIEFVPKRFKEDAPARMVKIAKHPGIFHEDDPVHDVMVTNEETEAERVVREMKADDRLRRIKTEDEANEERKADRERKIKADEKAEEERMADRERKIKAEDAETERKIKGEDAETEERKADRERKIKGEDEAKEVAKVEKEAARVEKEAAKVVEEARKAEHAKGKEERDAESKLRVSNEMKATQQSLASNEKRNERLVTETRAFMIQGRKDNYEVQLAMASTEEEKKELFDTLKSRIADIENNNVSESSTNKLLTSRGLTDTDGSLSVTMEHVMAKAAIAENKKRARGEINEEARAEKEVLKAQKVEAAEEKKKAAEEKKKASDAKKADAAETKRVKDEQKELDRKIRAYDAQFQLSGGNTSANRCYRY
jgi:hypothetical protein